MPTFEVSQIVTTEELYSMRIVAKNRKEAIKKFDFSKCNCMTSSPQEEEIVVEEVC